MLFRKSVYHVESPQRRVIHSGPVIIPTYAEKSDVFQLLTTSKNKCSKNV